MKIDELQQLESEGLEGLSSVERRRFLQLGLAVTGVYLGGTVLSLTSVGTARAAELVPEVGQYKYSPHYSMVIREKHCIDCERCMDACVKTNDVPVYGFRTKILERRRTIAGGEHETIFMPVLCNQCNRPPCVRVCPNHRHLEG